MRLPHGERALAKARVAAQRTVKVVRVMTWIESFQCHSLSLRFVSNANCNDSIYSTYNLKDILLNKFCALECPLGWNFKPDTFIPLPGVVDRVFLEIQPRMRSIGAANRLDRGRDLTPPASGALGTLVGVSFCIG
jgi:hypothetical protein